MNTTESSSHPKHRTVFAPAYEWIKEYSPDTAIVWMNGLFRAIQSLNQMPLRCSIAFENEFFDEEYRLRHSKLGQSCQSPQKSRGLGVADRECALLILHVCTELGQEREKRSSGYSSS